MSPSCGERSFPATVLVPAEAEPQRIDRVNEDPGSVSCGPAGFFFTTEK